MVWALDLIENVGPPNSDKLHILVAVCCFSKFTVLAVLPDKRSTTVAAILKDRIMAQFGTPTTIRTDNGTPFAGSVKTWC